MIRKCHTRKLQTNPRHREEEPHNSQETPGGQIKQKNQPLPIKMTANLEWTLSNVQQNTDQPHTPTMGVTLKNKSTKSNRLSRF